MLKLWFCFFTLAFVGKIYASNITVSMSENLPEDVKNNINAYLGELPNDEPSRISFVYSVKANTIKALQALGYYRSEVNTTLTKNKTNTPWQLAIDIQLKDVTLVDSVDVNITGQAQQDAMFTTLTANLALKPKDPLNHGRYQKIKSDIVALALQRGYFDGYFDKSQIAITPENKAKVSLSYMSGQRYKFGKVSFFNNTVDQDFINKLVPFNYTDDYEVAKLQKFQNNLEKTQYFSNIVIVPNQEDPSAIKNKLVPIQVSLKEAKKHYFDIGFGYATDTEFRISGGWRTPLVNKYGHRQETQIKYSRINPTGRFTYSIPLDGSFDNIIQFRLLLENNDYGGIESNHWSSRVSKINTEELSNSEYYVRYLHEQWDEVAHLNKINDVADYFLFGFSWSTTRRSGSLIDPSDGFSQFYNIEATHTDISSEASFVKLYANWRYIKTLKPKHRIVTRAELGYTLIDSSSTNAGELSPSLRFFAGGDQSIRGFAYQSVGPTRQIINPDNSIRDIVVGGNRLAVASIEYQYYFTPEIRGAIFADMGSSFDKGFKRKYSVGPGIHYISPIGAIKLDVGYTLSEDKPSWRLHLNLGAEL